LSTIFSNCSSINSKSSTNNIPIIWVRGTHPELEKQQIEEIEKEPFHLQTHVHNDNHCCRMGTNEYEFYGPVKSLILDTTNTDNDHFIVKEWYSCFKNTDLKDKLDSIGITNIIVTGVATNVCVFSQQNTPMNWVIHHVLYLIVLEPSKINKNWDSKKSDK
jgi:nicotinamidase-related amidase